MRSPKWAGAACTAVIYLTNFWEWSGGMMTYLYWTNGGRYIDMNDPAHPWPEFAGHDRRNSTRSAPLSRCIDDYVRAVVGTAQHGDRDGFTATILRSWRGSSPMNRAPAEATKRATRTWQLISRGSTRLRGSSSRSTRTTGLDRERGHAGLHRQTSNA